MSDAKKKAVLESAHHLFLRYGYRRTTMGDLAKAAQISRPALYLLYANKEEIFRAVTSRYFEKVIKLAKKRSDANSSLSDKLMALMKTWIEQPYLELMNSPESNEIYESGHILVKDLKRKFSDIYISQIHEIIESSNEVSPHYLSKNNLSFKAIATLLARSSSGLKREAQDIKELRTLLKNLVEIHLMAIVNKT